MTDTTALNVDFDPTRFAIVEPCLTALEFIASRAGHANGRTRSGCGRSAVALQEASSASSASSAMAPVMTPATSAGWVSMTRCGASSSMTERRPARP